MSCASDPPECIRKLDDKFRSFRSPESIAFASQYQPKDTDVFIVGIPKCGTTWIQQIMHGLRSGGDMDFEEMSEAIPVIEFCYLTGIRDLHAPQKYQPNMYKSHMWYYNVPKGNAKHIIVVRDPADVAVSRFYFFEGWLYEKGDVTLEEFVEWFYIKPIPQHELYWNAVEMKFITQTYPHRKDKGVLWLHYDDLKEDLKGCVKLISDFMGIGVGDQELLDLVEHQASFEFMKKHKDKFDTRVSKKLLNKVLGDGSVQGLEESGSKVRKGISGEGRKEISPKQLKALDARWKELVQPICGYPTFEEMRMGINKELGRSFSHH